MDVLKEEGRKLTAKKKQLYGEYQKARRDMQEIVTIKANIDTLMGYTEPGLIFAGTDEVITFNHTAYSRAIFAKGALSAAKFLAGKEPGLYDMADVVGL